MALAAKQRRSSLTIAGFLAIGFINAEVNAAGPSAFSFTGPLITGRLGHTSTLLPNGKVLVVGGEDYYSDILTSAEIFDPSAGTWSFGGAATSNFDTATLLQNGQVLFVGGTTIAAVLYDPAAGTFTATGSTSIAHSRASATLLANGKVLLVGGVNPATNDGLKTCELYNPATGTWSTTGNLTTGRLNQTATLLTSGKVVVAGGGDSTTPALQSAELYDPTSGNWSSAGHLVNARTAHVATLLPSGKVLVEGGASPNPGTYYSSAELYDPSSGTWSATGSLAKGRYFHTATLLASGKVLVTGGFVGSNASPLASAELYDPAAGTWSAAGTMGVPRYLHTATLLPNGKVLLAGGTYQGALAATELYDPTASAAASRLQNISTRANVLTDDNVMIGGFIITGTGSKRVVLRAIGPSLGLSGELADPTLELHMPDGSVITNDNWKIDDKTGQSQQAEIEATTIPPTNDLESALVETLAPGSYTAIVKGKNATTGVALVEVYDLDQNPTATLANISTRGFVDVDNNVMIGGFILGPSNLGYGEVLVRAIGPSLTVTGPLADPTLELHDGNGDKVGSNNDWQNNDLGGIQIEEILSTTIAPKNMKESALLTTLLPGNYTVVVSGVNGTTGVGLVEVYNLRQ